MSSHPSLPLQLPSAHTIMMICFADAFPGTNTHFKDLQRQKEFLSMKEQMVNFYFKSLTVGSGSSATEKAFLTQVSFF